MQQAPGAPPPTTSRGLFTWSPSCVVCLELGPPHPQPSQLSGFRRTSGPKAVWRQFLGMRVSASTEPG